MLLISCPWCGPRDEVEFRAGGEADRVRPHDPSLLGDQQWADFLFMRRNEKGLQRERWNHSAGCRRWFVVERNNITHEISPSLEAGQESAK
jgi:sarcosine oxidase subunit delta